MSDREKLRSLINELAVVRGQVILSSGQQADYYVDLRRVTLHHEAAPLVGRLMCELVADWDFDAVGGMTLGADPVATAMLHHCARPMDAFVVRKSGKAHGMQRQVEGPDVINHRVLAVDDTSTTGSTVLTAIDVLRASGAEPVGVALIVDRGAGEAITAQGLECRAIFSIDDLEV